MLSSLEKHNEKSDPSKLSMQPSDENSTNLTSGIVSDKTMETIQVEHVNIDGVVNPNMLHSHLAMLSKFNSLEQQDNEIDQQYLLRAEKRYLLWLGLLNNKSFKDVEEVPIPPIDVCLIWHAHLLSPFRYYEDMRRLHDPSSKEYSFPLAKLHELWSQNKGDHFDERSKQFWEENTKQSWVLDPNDDSSFELVCPWCSTTIMIAAKCNCKLSVETLSAKRFLNDIQKYNDEKQVYIAGTLVSVVDGEYSEEKAISDSDYMFNLSTWKELLDKAKTSSENCNWEKISKKIKNRINELKSQRLFVNVRKGIPRNVIHAYSGIISPFSIELVSAVVRQREFTHKMVDNAWVNNITVQAQATIRYHRFLLLQKDTGKLLVPTLDIDLCWHTHMLFASLYRNFTKNHMNRIINHDDTLSKSSLADGFAETSNAWYKKFKEPYTCEHPNKYWLTTKKKIAAAILPPYAIYLMYKMNKYKKGTAKQENTQNVSKEANEKIADKEKG
ncbi:1900_t:CDS:2 [Dentiscutata erythropus]|uniref:1900_t:CDS:1 n=1 Tax=Dentiscutata erythropus TaxID=1348616 RepID=A0A9N9AER3_9GLOM|nr:1900_t:CDS:2 [Dentiscutata erythropus]